MQFQTNFWPQPDPDWQQYKTQFLDASGRIIDTGNKNVSHSEGQSWGMLLSVNYDDQQTFDNIWNWTQTHLQIRDDALLAWRWTPETDAEGSHVTDQNNASDADLYTAWALIRASKKWADAKYADDARTILTTVKTKLIKPFADQTVLLPGAVGFERDDHLILNLSYWVFPALRDISKFDQDPVWNTLIDSGLSLIEQAQFGQWQLPADWIALYIDHSVKPSEDFPVRFSYDAIRIPLSLAWLNQDMSNTLAPYQALQKHLSKMESTPAWIDLETGTFAPYAASDGMLSVLSLASHHRHTNVAVTNQQDYYSASLILLSRLASSEISAP